MKKYLYSISILAAFMTQATMAQNENNRPDRSEVGKEEVTIVSDYQATLSDVFKINDNPLISDEDLNQRRAVNYTIFSVPVASTFIPEKGAAAQVNADSLAHFYNNYALLGYGNYGTLRGELGIVEHIGSKNVYLGGLFKHHSSDGGIEGLFFDDDFRKTSLDFNFGQKNTNNQWKAQFGAMDSRYSWYGTPENFNPSDFSVSAFDAKHKFNDVHLSAVYESYSKAFEKMDISYKYFWDDFDSKESRFILNPKFQLNLPNSTKVHVDVEADYLNTSFSTYNSSYQYLKSNYFNLSLNPSVRFFDTDYSVELGAGLTYILGKNNGIENNSVVVYPMIKANYDLVKDIVQAYAGAVGGVKQNSYADLAEENPFVAPELELNPTKTLYDLYLGMRGKLYHNISYNIKAGFKSEDDKAMFNIYPIESGLTNRMGFQYGNSFGILYDQIKTYYAFGALNFEFTDEVALNLSGTYYHFKAENFDNVYHLPQAKINANVLINFNERWFSDLNFAYIGQRFDYIQPQEVGGIMTDFDDKEIEDFVDFNLTVGYRPSSQWMFFLKGNNIFNQNYYRFNQYQTQGFQVFGGAMYKFDLK